MKDNNKLKLTLLRISLAFAVLLLAFMTSYNVRAVGAMKTADDATEQARVAGWSIDVTCEKDAYDRNKTLAVAYTTTPLENPIASDAETNYYIAKVNNKSEVAGKYSIVLTKVPDNVAVKLYRGSETEAIEPTELEGKIVFTDLEKLSPNQTGSDLKIVFIPTSAVSVTETEEILITFKVDQDNGQA